MLAVREKERQRRERETDRDRKRNKTEICGTREEKHHWQQNPHPL